MAANTHIVYAGSTLLQPISDTVSLPIDQVSISKIVFSGTRFRDCTSPLGAGLDVSNSRLMAKLAVFWDHLKMTVH